MNEPKARKTLTPDVLWHLDNLLGQIRTHRHLFGLSPWQECDQCLEVAGYLVEVIRMDQVRAAQHQEEER